MKNAVRVMNGRTAGETTPMCRIYQEESCQLLNNQVAAALLSLCHELSGNISFKRDQLSFSFAFNRSSSSISVLAGAGVIQYIGLATYTQT
jgi:hypothetical protein